MPNLTPEEAWALAEDWIAAWNARDLQRVLAHYTEEVAFQSPLLRSLPAIPAATFRGHHLHAYWALALGRLPELRFRLLDLLQGSGCLTLYYQDHYGTVAETCFLDDAGQFTRATACYALARPDWGKQQP